MLTFECALKDFERKIQNMSSTIKTPQNIHYTNDGYAKIQYPNTNKYDNTVYKSCYNIITYNGK